MHSLAGFMTSILSEHFGGSGKARMSARFNIRKLARCGSITTLSFATRDHPTIFFSLGLKISYHMAFAQKTLPRLRPIIDASR